MGWADNLVSGFSTGYSIGQDAQDRARKRKLADFEIAQKQRESDRQKVDDEIGKSAADIVKNRGLGLDGDGMGPPADVSEGTQVAVAPAPEAAAAPAEGVSGPVDNSVMRAAPGDTPASAPVGLPASQVGVGPGQSRSAAAMESGGQVQPAAAQAANGVQPVAKLPKVEVTAKKATEKTDIYKEKIRLAEERGLTDLAGKYRLEHGKALVLQAEANDAQWKLENKDAMAQLAAAKTTEEMQQLQAKAQQRQIQMGGTMLYLWQHGMKDQARAVSKHSSLGGEGWELEDIRPGKDGTLEIIGKGGTVDMTLTPDQVRGFIGMSGAAPKTQTHVLSDGAVLTDDKGKVLAENKKDPRAAPEQTLQRQNQATSILGTQYGTRDAMGNLMISPEKKSEHDAVLQRSHELVRTEGIDAAVAIKRAQEEYKKGTVKPPAGAPGAPAVPPGYTPPWKKK